VGRQLLRSPIFSVADAVLLRPLPYPDSGRLVVVWNELSNIGVRKWVSAPRTSMRSAPDKRVLEMAAAFKEEDRNVVTRKGAGRAVTLSSTRGLLEMLGARAAIGRLFTADEWQADRNQVVIQPCAVCEALCRGSGGHWTVNSLRPARLYVGRRIGGRFQIQFGRRRCRRVDSASASRRHAASAISNVGSLESRRTCAIGTGVCGGDGGPVEAHCSSL